MNEQVTMEAMAWGGAIISPCGRYRYELSRKWGSGNRLVLWIMLNPSTADAAQDDPTIRRCIGFSQAWGFDGLLVGNLYAYRATKPADLIAAGDARFSEENHKHIISMAERAELIVGAWGANAEMGAIDGVLHVLKHRDIHALAKTSSASKSQPKHPLYLSAALKPFVWLQKSVRAA